MAIIISMAIGLSWYSRKSACEAQEKAAVEKMQIALDDYLIDNGAYPVAIANVSDRLAGSVTFSNGIPLDPWGRTNYNYRTNSAQSFTLVSAGFDGLYGTADVLIAGK